MFKNTPSSAMTDIYTQSREIPENGLNKQLETNQHIYLYTLNQYSIFGPLQKASFFRE